MSFDELQNQGHWRILRWSFGPRTLRRVLRSVPLVGKTRIVVADNVAVSGGRNRRTGDRI